MRSHSAFVPSLAVLFTTAALSAQGSFALDKTTDGRLAFVVGFDFAGAPAGSTLLFMTSSTSGPIPLSIVDPADPRALSVGLELAPLWFTVPTGTGSGQVGLPTPNDASLAGLMLNFQGLTVPGSSLVFGAMSNPVTQQLGLASTPVGLPRNLVTGRALAQVFRVGRDVMLAGGGQGSLLGATGLASTERYDFRGMTVAAGPSMTTPRALAFATRLSDGRVLVCGGVDATGVVLASAEVFDPATNTFTPTGSMTVARAAFDGTILADGRVMVAGGTTTLADAVAALSNAQDTVEIWSPTSGTWTRVASMGDRLLAPDLTLLTTGSVLLSGGFDVNSLFGFPLPVGSITTCRRYNPTTNIWSSAAAMTASRGAHGFNTVRLGDGRVLVTGGATSGPDLTQAASIASAEVYNPTTNSWFSLPAMAAPRAIHSATLTLSGKVLIAGGAGGTLTAPIETASVQLFDPATNGWSTLGNLVTARAGHAGALTDDGLIVLFGGQAGGGTSSLNSLETIRP
ncbi:MAG: hypothetical protein HZB39_15805 [Planctomycetes bacterium]|nr:hypothetical protein [Planctomycetota bacterium]